MKSIEKVIESRDYLLKIQKERLIRDIEREALDSDTVRKIIEDAFRKLLGINAIDFSTDEAIILDGIVSEFN